MTVERFCSIECPALTGPQRFAGQALAKLGVVTKECEGTIPARKVADPDANRFADPDNHEYTWESFRKVCPKLISDASLTDNIPVAVVNAFADDPTRQHFILVELVNKPVEI